MRKQWSPSVAILDSEQKGNHVLPDGTAPATQPPLGYIRVTNWGPMDAFDQDVFFFFLVVVGFELRA
jgi:hypothetical protein